LTAENSVFLYSNANDMCVTQDLTLSGRLYIIIAHAQCSVDEKKNIYIRCVPHKNNCTKKIGSHNMKQTDSSISIVKNVCVLTLSIHDCLSFLHEVMIGNHRNKTTES